jgi:hypothetical protein
MRRALYLGAMYHGPKGNRGHRSEGRAIWSDGERGLISMSTGSSKVTHGELDTIVVHMELTLMMAF